MGGAWACLSESIMSENDKQSGDSYSVEDDAEGDPQTQDPGQHSAQVTPSDVAEPMELEADDHPRGSADDDAPAKSGVRELDVCPNCGAPMREGNRIVCLRCGFDLKTLKVLKTQTGEQTEQEQEDEEEDEPPEPLSLPGRGDYLLPGIMAGLSVLLITIGYLVGADGLFNLKTADGLPIDPVAADRFAQWGVYLAYLVLGSLCALAGLFIVARLNERAFGDWRRGILRTVGIIATVWLAKFLDLGGAFIELSVEWILHAGIFVGLSMFFFRLTPRDAATAGLTGLLVAVVFWALAAIIT